MELFRTAWEFLRSKKRYLVALIVFQLGQVILSLWLPSLNAQIIDHGILANDRHIIYTRGMLMLGISLVQISFMVLAIYFGSKLAMEFGRDLRATTFRHVQNFSAVDQHKFGAPTLITRVTNDITQMQMVVLLTFTIMITAPIMGIGGIIMALEQDAGLSKLLLIIVPALALLIGVTMALLTPRYQIQQARVDRINTLLCEQLAGVRVIRAFVRQKTEAEKFDVANEELRSVWLQIGWLWAFMLPTAFLIVGLSSCAVIWFGGQRVSIGDLNIGALTAYINYLMMILMSVMMSGMMAMFYPRGEISAKRIAQVRNQESTIVNPANPRELPASPLLFELKDASLRFPGAEEPVLSGINMTLEQGRTVALIGSTGSGKTSLIRLFPRLIDVSSGSITAGGVPVNELDLHELRSKIAIVAQRAFLFSGTIGENVAGTVGSDVSYDVARVKQALELAQAWEFVSTLDGQIEAKVESGGKNFSGGQRQRLTIARALYRCLPDTLGHHDADLLIFDDSFSALDYATDARLRAALKSTLTNVAVLIVAQRVATIRNADEICVLDNGLIVGRGTHAELFESCTTYQEIVQSQLTAEEAK
ncbi:ATP-binding cassette subfamily B protein [Arcanobacterium pluranimalium]|uniref:ABC transporter ATP-binding protein n=1 Tax=Arcanobacterium pluranimalium TaxID=108028 RepID=UPI001957E3AA|nr:ABC transporter ATP-binding protein [Arcanobacterium pluranimalium]MBM7825557.1 ATP-binding cassette subfamily B protein [Arcanobacterium pluranimalium]